MNSLARLALWETGFLLGGVFGVVFWMLATGRISLDGMLEADVRDPDSPDQSGFSAAPSLGRAQALAATLFVAGWYLLQVLNNPKEFPHIPNGVIAVMGSSHAVYLTGKAYGLLWDRLKAALRNGG